VALLLQHGQRRRLLHEELAHVRRLDVRALGVCGRAGGRAGGRACDASPPFISSA
jgi:hypothetical protein